MNTSYKLPTSEEVRHLDLTNRIESIVRKYNDDLASTHQAHSHNLNELAKGLNETLANYRLSVERWATEINQALAVAYKENDKRTNYILWAIAISDFFLFSGLLYLGIR